MKFLPLILLLISVKLQCQEQYIPRDINKIVIESVPVEGASIRAIAVLPDSSAVFATSNGYIGKITFKKDLNLSDQVLYDTIIPHFRSIAVNNGNIFALSVANPALLYKYNGKNFELVYKESHPDVFYDAMTFIDNKIGIAMGDPVDGCLSIIMTADAGEHWKKLPCSQLPKIKEGEAAFAASNSNIAVADDHIWLVTGGKYARVFHSPDKGNTWGVVNTPIIQGEAMTGIYSIDFQDSTNGIIFGGNWNDKQNNKANKATTHDGGSTWQLIADGEGPGYRSCVQYVPDTNGKEIFAVGTEGISFSNDGGKTWKKISDDGYYTIRLVNKNLAWLAGNEKIGKMTFK